jgi:hypothetical protein
LTLLLDQASQGAALVSAPQCGHDALFAYFTEQAFGRVSETTQAFLMETAVLAHHSRERRRCADWECKSGNDPRGLV